MRGWREWKERRRGPAEEKGDGLGEESADPAEVSLYVAVAEELGVGLGRERTREKNPKEEQYDSADLARKRGLRRPIVPVPARAL